MSEPYALTLQCLSLNAGLDLSALAGQRVVLTTRLADGRLARRSAVVREAASLGADAGFARYRLELAAWLWLASQATHSRVWQDKTVAQIVADVLAAYASVGEHRWAPEAQAHPASTRARPYCVQYRETDLAFITRLLAEEGLGYWLDEGGEDTGDGSSDGSRDSPRDDSRDDSRDSSSDSAGTASADTRPSATPRMVIFSDSARFTEETSAKSPLGGRGLRFHRAAAPEEQDTLQHWGATRGLHAAVTTLLGWDQLAKRSVAASVPTLHAVGGAHAPVLEAYDWVGADAFEDSADAQRRAEQLSQTAEARNQTFEARSTVRSLRPGRWFELVGSTFEQLTALGPQGGGGGGGGGPDPASERQFSLLGVTHAARNNLPKALAASLAQSSAATPVHPQAWEPADVWSSSEDTGTAAFQALSAATRAALIQQVQRSGYANAFSCIRRAVPWRPALADTTGSCMNPRMNPRPTALGVQTAIVVGADGQSSPSGADELHMDALGRIRVRFHWQAGERADDRSSCWLRVAQPYAGAGLGLQFIPRIGHEVLVQFLGNDIDRPVVLASVYNGQGEAGERPTPGGRAAGAASSSSSSSSSSSDASSNNAQLFGQSTDHTPSAQGNLIGAGNAPAWHGAGAGEAAQRNAAALSGYKTKEFGGAGSNQLVFDDSDAQLSTSLQSSAHASWLNLGHLLHRADNHRGSLRGVGWELRTDAFGALRGQRGVLLTSYGKQPGEPAGDNAAGMALAKQAQDLARAFARAARTHQGTGLAGDAGVGASTMSALDATLAPVQAMRTALQGMVHASDFDQAQGDAGQQPLTQAASTADAADGTQRVPHSSAAVIAISAKAGFGQVAGQDIQLAAGETINLTSGQDAQWAVGHALRVHTGQSIGIVAGAVQAGSQGAASSAAGKGLTLVAAKGDLVLQAQADAVQVAAKLTTTIQSAAKHIDIAAAKKVTIATAGGASITIEAGQISVKCPGTISVKAGSKSLVGPVRFNQDMPSFPKSTLVVPMLLQFDHAPAGGGSAWAGMPFKLYADGAMVKQGVLDESGTLPVMHSPAVQSYKLEMANGVQYDMPLTSSYKNSVQGEPANLGFLKHQPGASAADTGDTPLTDTLRAIYSKAFPA